MGMQNFIDVMGDVVDSVDSSLLGPRKRFCNARCGHAKLPRHIGEGEPELRDEVDRQFGPHGRDPAPAAAHLQFREADPRLPTPAANQPLGLGELVGAGHLRRLPDRAGRQHAVDERPGPEHAWIRPHPLRSAAHCANLGPAAQRADQAPTD